MSRGLGRVIRSGVRRQRVQTAVIVLVAAAAVTASVLGAGLLVASRAPFDRAFTDQRGAHLSVQAKGPADRLAATATLAGVTGTAGPFAQTAVSFTDTAAGPHGEGRFRMPELTVVGRSDFDAGVDDVTLLNGRWATGPGELVINNGRLRMPVGTVLEAEELPGKPELTVVGVAHSITGSANAWVPPAELAGLTKPGGSVEYQMLYRFASARTAAEVAAGRAAISSALPAGAVVGAQSWLDIRRQAVEDAALFVPFLVAFAALGLIMSTIVVGSVVAGAVGAAIRRIGVLKALGCTPGQVVRAYAGQAVIPAVFGTAIGVVAGNLLALPVLAEADEVYGSSGATIPWWVDAAVVAFVLALVGLTAAVTALRAGRLRTVDALAVGRTTGSGRGRAAAALTARLPLPRPIGLGLARPLARPVRTVAMLLAIAFGAAAATFSIGLSSTLLRIQAATGHESADVVIEPQPGGQTDPAAVLGIIRAQPGTEAAYAGRELPITAAGLTEPAEGIVVTGDNSWDGFEMVSGRWFGAGEAVASSKFLTDTGTAIGDTVTLTAEGNTAAVRIVGEVFETGPVVLTATDSWAGAQLGEGPPVYQVAVTDGTDPAAYAAQLTTQLSSSGLRATPNAGEGADELLLLVQSLTGALTLLLVSVAGLGVLNTVILDLRDRIRDLGISKALGMTPRQTVVMVLTSVAGAGLIGGLIGVPAGMALQGAVIPAMGRIAGIGIPEVFLDVYDWPLLVLLTLGGLGIAVVGALIPAGWAARVRVSTALRTE